MWRRVKDFFFPAEFAPGEDLPPLLDDAVPAEVPEDWTEIERLRNALLAGVCTVNEMLAASTSPQLTDDLLDLRNILAVGLKEESNERAR